MGTRGLCVLLLSTLASGDEPEASVAEPSRWTGPHGPASNSRRSRALPVRRDVVEAWSFKLPSDCSTPPVHWGGVLYAVADVLGRGRTLFAIDLKTGTKIASKSFRQAPPGPMHVWGNQVFMLTTPSRISGIKRNGRSFIEIFKFGDKSFGPRHFTVFENELFVATSKRVYRLAPGTPKPLWQTVGEGPLAVLGPWVFARITPKRDGRAVDLVAINRASGKIEARGAVAYHSRDGGRRTPTLTVTRKQAIVGGRRPFATTAGSASHAFVPLSLSRNTAVSIGKCTGLASFGVWPGVCRDGFITTEGRERWMWWRGRKGRFLAERKNTPDLFRQIVSPTIVGEIAYFGTWAADMVTGEVLWRLPIRSIRHAAIPADRMVIVVDESDVIHAYRERLR